MKNTNFSPYPYSPSKAAAIISVIIFSALVAVHTFKLYKTRTWFAIPFVIGTLFETLGYLARVYGSSHPYNFTSYIAQMLLILIAPILIAASIYMFFGRIVRATRHEEASIIRSTWLTKIFLGGDILCFFVQAGGATMLAKTDASQSTKDLGKRIVLAGLIIQLFVFGFFVVIAAMFQMRARKIEDTKGLVQTFNWQRYLYMLYVVSGLVTARNVYRVAEYVGGEEGYLMAHEWPLYIFDAVLMAVALAICTTWYIGDIVAMMFHATGDDTHVMMAHQTGYGERV